MAKANHVAAKVKQVALVANDNLIILQQSY